MTDAIASIDASYAQLPDAMRQALVRAFDAADAGSLAIGACIAADDRMVATGRNRLHEIEVGDDHVAGTSLAHAEINALAKLRFRAHESDELELHTTLQPCVQCLGAIRLAPISRVVVLTPDPLWIGVEQIRDATSFLAERWPRITTLPATEWSVLALLSPTRHALDHPRIAEPWRSALPTTSDLAEAVDLADLVGESPPARAAAVWGDLSRCIDEVEELAERARVHQG
ncbi:MAG: deaminase [Actinomycetota bacterium]